ncbi:asparaginase [Candidatus Bipolaricaulota bacterium]|jgi:L-asparaginase|nr:asparaginase [Candidatus Bipolaricaulota bacterium]
MKITILTTGGTIEKTYNEHDGSLRNYHTILPKMLSTLRLPDLDVTYKKVVFKDSLEMTEEDRRRILDEVRRMLPESDAIVILHGTDTLSKTGELLHRELAELRIPIILTGAMRPYEFRDTDAVQNVTESLLAARLIPPGVYVVMHNRVLRFPGVVKDHDRLTFTKP